MASPFPGMDPYLEDRALWNDVHHRLITYINNALQRQVRLRYHGRIEERLYVEEAKREIVPIRWFCNLSGLGRAQQLRKRLSVMPLSSCR